MATAEKTTKPAARKTAAKKAPAKVAAKDTAIKKPRAPRKPEVEAVAPAAAVETVTLATKPTISGGRYVLATGRRKTAIANVRLFSGSKANVVNKKPLDQYFFYQSQRDTLQRPLALTGLLGDFHFTATVNGGGMNAQAEAVRHGIAQALASLSDDLRNILKKNGFLTRDPREKERKKPGLRRARRSPQWAKR